MAKRDPQQEYWDSLKAERVRREAQKKHRSRIQRVAERNPHRAYSGKPDLNAALRDINSPDDQTRAAAVRNLCPCRIGWQDFQQAMDAVEKGTKDRSKEVRRNALHVFEDAFMMQRMESRETAGEWMDTPDDDAIERTRQREREIKLQAKAAFGRRQRAATIARPWRSKN